MASNDPAPATVSNSAPLARLASDDVIGQLRRQDGLMRELGSDSGVTKLDWVDAVARLIGRPAWLGEVFEQARDIAHQGVRHVIWAGMGGSGVAVRALVAQGLPGLCDPAGITLHLCDSTDPAALNAIVHRIAHAKRLRLPKEGEPANAHVYRALLDEVLMVAVSMGMTSEEPVSHVVWFRALLDKAGMDPARHVLVMTLPGSSLDRYAALSQVPVCPVHVGTATGFTGRTSAPATRVFLLPASLCLVASGATVDVLAGLLSRAWHAHGLDRAADRPQDHPFVLLAVALTQASREGVCQLMLDLPESWCPLRLWVEQLMEQSLGKHGKGAAVFCDQRLPGRRRPAWASGVLHVTVRERDGLGLATDVGVGGRIGDDGHFTLDVPSLDPADAVARLEATVCWFLGWQLSAALYGYLQAIEIAPEPAVERYKALSRILREQPHPLEVLSADGPCPNGVSPQPDAFAAALLDATRQWHRQGMPGYLDLTINGETQRAAWDAISAQWRTIGNTLLGVPVKLRRAPAEYHVSEQSEMAGPRHVVSLRVVNDSHDVVALGDYDDRFLKAQAIASWQAMNEQGRACYLLVTRDRRNVAQRPGLITFLSRVEACLHDMKGDGDDAFRVR